MSLTQRIQEEIYRTSGESNRLREENRTDIESLDDLKRSYNVAVITSDEEGIDRVNSQIKEVNSRITRRKEMIEAYRDENNPLIQAMVSEKMTAWLNELSILEEQAADKKIELMVMRANLVDGLLEMNGMKDRSVSLRNALNVWTKQLNERSREEIGLPKSRFDLLSPVTTSMRTLLIQDNEVFK